MDFIKSNNHLVNTLLFPGSVMLSSYDTDTFNDYNSDFDPDELQLLYIPFHSEKIFNYCHAPKQIPAILQIARKNAASVFIIHLHGNACDIGQVSMCAKRESYSLNGHYMIVEYPSYGISNGISSENLVDEIVYAVYNFVTKILKVPSHKIVLMGRSIGTGPVCKLASVLEKGRHPPAAIILQSPYTSLKYAASDLVGPSISCCMLDRWENWKVLCNDQNSIKIPVLFIHADGDQIIDCHHSESMHAARLKMGLPSHMYIQKSTYDFIKDHNHYDYDADVIIPSRDFLAKYVPFSGFWGINTDIIKQYVIKPYDFTLEKGKSKIWTISNCIRWSICPYVACCEAGTALTCSALSVCNCHEDENRFKYLPKSLRNQISITTPNNMKKVKRFLKTGSIRSTLEDDDLSKNKEDATRNPILHETIIFDVDENGNVDKNGSKSAIEFIPG